MLFLSPGNLPFIAQAIQSCQVLVLPHSSDDTLQGQKAPAGELVSVAKQSRDRKLVSITLLSLLPIRDGGRPGTAPHPVSVEALRESRRALVGSRQAETAQLTSRTAGTTAGLARRPLL